MDEWGASGSRAELSPGWQGELRRAMADVGTFSALLPGLRLRGYQVGPARAIAESVVARDGRQFAVVFSRQAGKDELLAQVTAYLLVRFGPTGGNVVVAAPTFQPQAALCRDRLLDRLGRVIPPELIAVAGGRGTRDGYAVRVGRATARFLSAAPGAGARGQTADLLLVANEAQDIRPEIWDAVFDPMAASTNATTLFLGTVWSRETLLARQMRFLEERERADGARRLWRVAWEEVAAALPVYGERVRARIAQFGPHHPFVRTEYCLEELEGEGGLFPPHRLAQLAGDHPRRHRAEAGKRYALLVDVAGEEEGGTGPLAFADAGRRDSTALTVVEIEGGKGARGQAKRGGGEEMTPPCPLPVYRVVDRRLWTGVRHTALHAQVVDLARAVWRASAVVVDATGIGAGLASFLAAELGAAKRGGRRGVTAIPVIPFVFSTARKSALGWDFLGLIDTGRFKEYADDGDPVTALYWAQLRATTYEAPSGDWASRPLRWGVPAGRGPGHDDLVVSAALVCALEGIDWRARVAVGTSSDS